MKINSRILHAKVKHWVEVQLRYTNIVTKNHRWVRNSNMQFDLERAYIVEFNSNSNNKFVFGFYRGGIPAFQLSRRFNSMVERLCESKRTFLSDISKIYEKLLFARKWMKQTNNKLKQLKGEKLNLMKFMNQLEKRVGELEKMVKEKAKMCSEEETREAIRQLCIWIDFFFTSQTCRQQDLQIEKGVSDVH